jgi:hypothetical protein
VQHVNEIIHVTYRELPLHLKSSEKILKMIIQQLGYSNCMQSLFCNSQHLTQGPEKHNAGEFLA